MVLFAFEGSIIVGHKAMHISISYIVFGRNRQLLYKI